MAISSETINHATRIGLPGEAPGIEVPGSESKIQGELRFRRIRNRLIGAMAVTLISAALSWLAFSFLLGPVPVSQRVQAAGILLLLMLLPQLIPDGEGEFLLPCNSASDS